MGSGMPFVVEKGPVWDFFDHQFSPGGVVGDAGSRLRLLNNLYGGVPKEQDLPFSIHKYSDAAVGVDATRTWETLFIGSSFADPDLRAMMPEILGDHIEQDWFVDTPNGDKGWMAWRGSPAEVVCRGIARAIEISLGLPHRPVELTTAARATANRAKMSEVKRVWPIEFYWVCPLPAMQCWVGWRPTESSCGCEKPGLVTFTFATPAPAWSYLAAEPGGKGPNGTGVDVDLGNQNLDDVADKDSGLVMVGHAETKPTCILPSTVILGHVDPAENENALPLKFQEWKGDGDVITVSPYDDVGGDNEPRGQS